MQGSKNGREHMWMLLEVLTGRASFLCVLVESEASKRCSSDSVVSPRASDWQIEAERVGMASMYVSLDHIQVSHLQEAYRKWTIASHLGLHLVRMGREIAMR